MHIDQDSFLCVIARAFLESQHRTHTGEKPFECKICASSVNKGTSLKAHQTFHTKEKPCHSSNCVKVTAGVSKLNKVYKSKCNHMGFMKLRKNTIPWRFK